MGRSNLNKGDAMETDLKSLFSQLEKDTKEIQAYKDNLISALSQSDQKITDIYHYIEFHPLNACQGYKISKLLQDTLKERREIKNEIEILGEINGFNLKSIKNGKLTTTIQNRKQKKYKPRVLKELFE